MATNADFEEACRLHQKDHDDKVVQWNALSLKEKARYGDFHKWEFRNEIDHYELLKKYMDVIWHVEGCMFYDMCPDSFTPEEFEELNSISDEVCHE